VYLFRKYGSNQRNISNPDNDADTQLASIKVRKSGLTPVMFYVSLSGSDARVLVYYKNEMSLTHRWFYINFIESVYITIIYIC